jgi:hypothetical protein
MKHSRKTLSGLIGLALLALVGLAAADTSPEPRAVSDGDSKWMLGDAEVFFKINVKQMMTSGLMKKGGLDKLKEAINGNEQVKTILDAAGLDVTKDVDSIVATGAGATPTDAKMRVVIKGRFDPEKISAAVTAKHKEIKVTKEGATSLYEVPVQDQTLFAAFADKNTLVMTQSKESTVEAVKNGGKKTAPMRKEMQAALGKFTGKESLTMAMVVTEEVRKMLQGVPRAGESAAKLQTLTAAMTLTDDVELAVRGITSDAKAAGQLSKLLEGLKAAAALAGDDVPKAALEIVDAIKVAADKESVKIDLKVTKELIEKASKGG